MTVLYDHPHVGVDVAVSQDGTATASAYGASVDSQGNVDLSGMVDRVMAVLDAHAPSFVRTLVNTAAQIGATEVAIQGAIATAVAALPAEMGATVAAFGPFAPVAAIVLAVPALLLAIAPASAGTGCCGTAPMSREQAIDFLRWQRDPWNLLPPAQHNFMPDEADISRLLLYSGQGATAAPCDPSGYLWDTSGYPAPAPGSAEAFVDAVIRTAHDAVSGCWTYMAPSEYPVALAAAVGAWNRAHPLAPVSLSRRVNVTVHHPAVQGGFAAYDQPGQPQDNEPISVAMNYAAMRYDAKGQAAGFLAGAGATATITPPTLHLQPVKEQPPAPAPTPVWHTPIRGAPSPLPPAHQLPHMPAPSPLDLLLGTSLGAGGAWLLAGLGAGPMMLGALAGLAIGNAISATAKR